MVYMEEDGSQHRGDSPTLFEKHASSRIGLVKVERLGGQQLKGADRNKALLTYSTMIRSPAGNRSEAGSCTMVCM